MAPIYDIEFEEPHLSRCACCEGLTVCATRFVYRDDDAFAVYYGRYSNRHPDSEIAMLISLGEWGEGSQPSQRVAFYCRVWPEGAGHAAMFDDAVDSPWGDSDLMGLLLSRDEALEHPWRADALAVLDAAIAQDPTLRGVLQRIECGDLSVPLERSYALPDALHTVKQTQPERIKSSGNFAQLDATRCFVRCLVPLQVEHYGVWSIGAWVEVSAADFETIRERWDTPEAYATLAVAGHLANDLSGDLGLDHPAGAPVRIHAPQPDQPPHIQPLTAPLRERVATIWPRDAFETFAVKHGYL